MLRMLVRTYTRTVLVRLFFVSPPPSPLLSMRFLFRIGLT